MKSRKARTDSGYAFAVTLAILAFLTSCRRSAVEQDLFLLCGAGLRPAVHEIVTRFTAETGIRVQVDYNASSLLLGKIRVGRSGDLFMPGDAFYIEEADKDRLVHESRNVAAFVPTIMVGAGNPKEIRTLADLTRDGMKLGFADERTAAIGRVARQVMEKNGFAREAYEGNIVFESVTVPELATAVEMGHVDAAIVWEPVARRHANAVTVAIPPEANIVSAVPVAVLSFSEQKELARSFVDFALSQQGQNIFREHGYGAGAPLNAE
jgi:molybdate transport system substrate-binding protein